jgi:spore coat protein A
MYLQSAKKKYGGCGEPWNLDNIEESIWLVQDKVLDSQCQLLIDHADAHDNNLYGDINLLNGVPFPLQNLDAKTYRFHILNAAVSRPYLLKIKNAKLQDMSQNICKVIAKDGGFRATPVAFPPAGLLIGVAERYEIVCDFTSLQGQTLYLWNDRDDANMKPIAYFCMSHLVSKMVIGKTVPGAPLFTASPVPAADLIPLTKIFTQADLNAANAMAAAGQYHRQFVFGRNNGMWTINGETWDTATVR